MSFTTSKSTKVSHGVPPTTTTTVNVETDVSGTTKATSERGYIARTCCRNPKPVAHETAPARPAPAPAEAAQTHFAVLESDASKFKKDLEDLVRQVADLKTENSRLNESLAAVNDQIQKEVDKNKKLKQDHSDREARLNKHHEDALAKERGQHKALLEQVKSDLDKKTSDIVSLRLEHADKMKKLELKANEKVAIAEGKLTTAKSQYQGALDQVNTDHKNVVAKLDQEIVILQQTHNQNLHTQNAYLGQIEELKGQLDDAVQRGADLKTQLDSALQAQETVGEENSKLSQENNSLKAANGLQSKKIDRSKETIETLTQEIERLKFTGAPEIVPVPVVPQGVIQKEVTTTKQITLAVGGEPQLVQENSQEETQTTVAIAPVRTSPAKTQAKKAPTTEKSTRPVPNQTGN